MIRQLDLGRSLDTQTPLATIATLSRQRGLQDQESQQNALQLQRLAQQIQDSKRKADEEVAAIAQAKQEAIRAEAIKNAQLLEGEATPPSTVGTPGVMETPPSEVLPPRTVAGVQVAAPTPQNAPMDTGYVGNEQIPPQVIPSATGGASITLRPQSERQLYAAARKKFEDQKRLEASLRPDRFASSPQGIFDTGTGKITAPYTKPPDLSNFQRDTMTFQGKPTDVLIDADPASPTKGHVFIGTEKGLQDVTGQVSHYEKPPASAATFNLNNPAQDDATVQYIANQVRDNPLNWNLTAGNKKLQDQVRQELARGGDVNRLTAATRQLGETADTVVPKIESLIEKLDDPKFVANLGPVMGRWNEFWTGKIGTNDPDLASLRAQIGLTQTGVMRAHVGARGGEGLLQKFESLADGSKMDAATLKGSLTGMRDFLQGYRDKIHPNQKPVGERGLVIPGGALEKLLQGGK